MYVCMYVCVYVTHTNTHTHTHTHTHTGGIAAGFDSQHLLPMSFNLLANEQKSHVVA